MIQSIKFNVNKGINDEGDVEEGELCFDYEDESISIYLDDKFICSLDYDNFKQGIKKMIEQW